MDIIEIKIELEPEADYSYGKDNKIESYIPIIQSDGLQHYEIRVTCWINGECIEQAFSIGDFLRSFKTGPHEIFTCSCGNAGCAGIWDGINVKNRRYTVEWRIPKNSNYSFLNRKFYSFKKEQYYAERENLYNKLVEYSHTDIVHTEFSHGCDEYNLMKNSIKWYKKSYEGKYWYE